MKGQWAVMSGGPMIGKSTLAGELAGRLNDDEHRAILISLKDADPSNGTWPLFFEAVTRQGMSWNPKNPYRKNPVSLPDFMTQIHHIAEKMPPQQRSKKLILLIDDCDSFFPQSEKLIPQIANMAMELTDVPIHAICWIGGLAWDAWAREHPREFIIPLRFYPLSVVPIREARQIISDRMGPAQMEAVWNDTGGHPYLMEQTFGAENSTSVDALVKRIYAELRPEEEALLDQLNPEGQWMPLEDLKNAEGNRPPKRLLDRLCMAGVMVRTLDHGTAVVRQTSPRLTFKQER
ncbi:MAG: hypothetical protein ACE5GK_12050 [Nitrospiria bacterium]